MTLDGLLPSDAPNLGEPSPEAPPVPAGELPSEARRDRVGDRSTSATQPSTSPSPARADTGPTADLKSRLTRATQQGGLTKLPDNFGERDGDWRLVLSDDIFERLYIDPSHSASVTPQLVKKHYDLFTSFWLDKLRLLHEGAGKSQLIAKYGGEARSEFLIASYPKRIEDAYHSLRDTDAIQRQLALRDQRRREAGEKAVASLLRGILADDALSQSETTEFFEAGAAESLTEAEIATMLFDQITSRGLKAIGNPVGESLAERLRSVDWMTDERRAKQSYVRPLRFGNGAAASVEELIRLCDACPADASDCLFEGDLANWLGGTFGDTSLSKIAREHMRAYANKRPYGLELFVRRLSQSAGINATPALALQPSVVDFGTIPLGAAAHQTIELQPRIRRVVWGTATVVGPPEGVTVTSQFNIGDRSLAFNLDTVNLQPGTYERHVRITISASTVSYDLPIRFTIVPLTIVLDPPQLDFGLLTPGLRRSATIQVTASPAGGRLVGTPILDPPFPAVTVSGSIYGTEATIQVDLATQGVPAGTVYQGVVKIESNAGLLEIPLQFIVQLRKALVVAWTVGGGLAMGMSLLLIRTFLQAHQGWLFDYSDKTLFIPGLVVGAVTIGALWLRLRKLSARVRG